MRVYVDTSALLKRVFIEPESVALRDALRACADDGDVLVSSSLAWVEVSRVVRGHADTDIQIDVEDVIEAALSGILEQPISPEVIALARRLTPPALRTLDAIHVAGALLMDADVVIAYDRRLIDAGAHHGLATCHPRDPPSDAPSRTCPHCRQRIQSHDD